MNFKFWKKKKKVTFREPQVLSDVFFDPKKKFINLKKHYWVLRIDPSFIQSFVNNHRRLVAASFTLIILIILAVVPNFSRANIATFYPSTCLGGWEHPENISGDPSLSNDAKLEDFNITNSARMRPDASVFCGGFKGEVPKDSKPTKFKLTLNWSVDDGSVIHSEPQPFTPVSDIVTPEVVAPIVESTDSNQDASLQNNNSDLQIIEDPNKDSSPTQEVPVTTQPASFIEDSSSASDPVDPRSESADSPSSDVGPQAFLQSLFKNIFATPAFAEDLPDSTSSQQTAEPEFIVEPAPEPEPVAPVSESTPDPTPESTSELVLPTLDSIEGSPISDLSIPAENSTTPLDDLAPTAQIGPNEPFTVEPTIDNFVEVSYTLDGTTWTSLGNISRTAWQRAEFDVPLKSWETLDNLQVQVKSLPTFDEPAVVYLDSMAMSVEYSSTEDLKIPTIILKDASRTLSGDSDFSANATATFAVIDPNLTVEDIRQLVDKNEAEVIEDKDGVLGAPVINEDEEDKDVIIHDVSTPSSILEKIEKVVEPIKSEVEEVFTIEKVEAEESTSDFMPEVTGELLDAQGNFINIPVKVTTHKVDGVDKQKIEIEKPQHSFHAGVYTLKLTMVTKEAIIISEQDFTWGVLAINIDNSVKSPGDNAYLQMGVLADTGHNLCNAGLTLVIYSPSNKEYTLSTEETGENQIIRNKLCDGNNVISTPDYYANFKIPNEVGKYKMMLTARTSNGERTITDYFLVTESIPLDVRRVGPTRIYPFVDYPMTIKVTAEDGWSGTVEEIVPASFQITEPKNSDKYENIEVISSPLNPLNESVKKISWFVNIKAGETVTLGYRFKAPPVSPEFYLLGPIELKHGGTSVFKESRQWQIASDPVNYYWVGGTGNWSDATNHWATSSGGAPGVGNAPLATGDCIFDTASSTANAAYTVTIDTAATCLSFIMDGPDPTDTNKVTFAGSSALAISGDFNLSGTSAGITRTYTGAITMDSITSQTITLGGVTLASAFTFSGAGGSWTLQDAFNLGSSNITLTNGTLNTNNQTVTFGSLSSSASNGQTLTLESSTVNTSGTWSLTGTSVLTTNTSNINLSGSGIGFTSSNKTYYNVTFTGAGNNTIVGANTFNNLTFTGPSVKTTTLSFSANQTINGIFNVTGPSLINRILIFSSVGGASRTITVGTSVSFSNVDFLDITTAGGAGTWTGSSIGNCGNNSGLTGTTPVTRYWMDTDGGSWSATGSWASSSNGSTGATVPLCHDTVVFDANSITSGSRTITADMPRMGAGITFAGDGSGSMLNTPTLASGSVAISVYGALTLISGMSITGTGILTFAPRSSVNLTNATKVFTQPVTIDAGAGGVVLQDDFDCSGTSANTLTVTTGTFNANNFNVKTQQFASNNSNTRTLTMGSGTWTIVGFGTQTYWNITTSTGLTFNANTSTIKFTENTGSGSAKTFAGGGLTYNNVWFTTAVSGTSTYVMAIAGSNTFNDFKWDRTDLTATNKILFTAASVTTVTTFSVSGVDATHRVTLNSNLAGTAWNISKASGNINRDYLVIQDSNALGGASWNAGANSTSTSGNTGWVFAGSCTATASGTWTQSGGSATFSGCTGTGGTPGTADNLIVNSGVTLTLAEDTIVVNSIVIDGSIDTSGTNYALKAKNLTIDATGTLVGNASTITLSGTTGVLFTQVSGGTFTYGTSTVLMTPDSAHSTAVTSTITGAGATSFYNLQLKPTISAARAWTFGAGAVTVNNNFDVDNAATGTFRLTVNQGAGGVTVVGTTTITKNGANTPTATFANNGVGFSTGKIVTVSGGTYTQGSSNITLTGTSSTLITNNGTWTGSVTGTMTLSGNGDATVISGTAPTIYNLTSSGTGTKTLGVSATVSNVFTISGGTFAIGSTTLTLSGTTGVPFPAPAGGGAFDGGTGTVTYSGANASGNTIIESSVSYYNLTLSGGDTYNPNGTITVNVAGTLTLTASTLDTTGSNHAINAGKISMSNSASSILTLNASTMTLNATSGTLFTKGGTSSVINAGTSTVIFNPDAAVTLFSATATTLYNVTLSPTITASRAYTLNGAGLVTVSGAFDSNPSGAFALTTTLGSGGLTVTGLVTLQGTSSGTTTLSTSSSNYALSVGSLNITSGDTLNINNSTMTVTGTTGILLTRGGTFTIGGTSTTTFSGDGSATLTDGSTWAFDAVNFTPTITADRTYTFGSGAVTMSGNVTVNPTASSTYTLTVNMGAGWTIGATRTLTIQGTTSGLSNLDTGSGLNYALSTGKLDIETGGTLTARASTITLTSTSSTLFTLGGSGAFTAGTSTVVMNPNASVTVTSGTFTGANALYNLTFSPALATSNKTYTFGSGAVTVGGAFDSNPPSGAFSLTTALGSGGLTVTGLTTLQGTTATSTLDTGSGLNYAFSTGTINITSGDTLNIRNSTFTVTGTTGTLITLGGTFTVGGTSTTVLSGNGDATINSAAITFDSLTSSGTGVKSTHASSAITIGSSDTLTVSGGTFDPLTALIATGSNTLTVSATIRVEASTFAGSYPAGFGTVNLNAGSTVDYYLGGTQTVDSTKTYVGLAISTSGTKSLNGDTTASTLTLNGGTLSASTYTITLTGTGVVFNYVGGTFSAGSSTIKLTDTSASSKTFAGGGQTFNNLWIAPGSGIGTYVVSGSNTFADFKDDGTGAHMISFTAGTTTTITTLTLDTDSASLLSLQSTNSGTAWNIVDTSGTNTVSYVSIKDSAASGGATFNASNGTNNNVSGNSGWTFAVTMTFANDDSTIGFGTLSSSSTRYATSTSGSGSNSIAHSFTITSSAPGGYVLTYIGNTLKSGANSITPAVDISTGGTVGTSQFGMSGALTSTGGTGAMSTSYNHATPKWTFVDDGASHTVASSSGAVTGDTIDMHYQANISGATPAGDYSTTITYILTGTF